MSEINRHGEISAQPVTLQKLSSNPNNILHTLGYLIYCIIESIVRKFASVKKGSFAGKLVLVTGAGQGIGRELAIQFSAIGARLILWDIKKDSLENVVREIQENGGTATAYVCDVSKADQVKSVADKVRLELGDVDVLVNNAGISHEYRLLALTDEEIKQTMGVNLLAPFWTCRQFLPSMINRNSGHIVNVASMAAKRGVAYLTDYSASKYGVAGFTEAMADEMRREGASGIHFTTVFPMFVKTGMTEMTTLKSKLDKMLAPEDVASAVVDAVQGQKKAVFIPGSMEHLSAFANLLPRRFLDEPTYLFNRGIHPRK